MDFILIKNWIFSYFCIMNLFNHYGEKFYRRTADKVQDSHLGIKVDYWYMAKPISKTSPLIHLLICTIIYDHTGNRFECKSIHQGEYKPWKEVIRSRLESHMLKVEVDKLMAKRITRDMDISKAKLIPFDRQEFLFRKT